MSEQIWRHCSSCRKDIGLNTLYWVCSVSTCNTKRRGLFFCSFDCFEVHLPDARHRRASAIERRSPKVADEPRSVAPTPKSKPVSPAPPPGEFREPPKEVLIVASRLGDFVMEKFRLKVSKSAIHALSHRVRQLADEAITRAGFDDRRTIMERDFGRPHNSSGGPVLIIASRFKSYVKAAGGMNTSGSVVDVLSGHVRALTDAAGKYAVAHSNRESLIEADFDHSELI